MARKRSRKRENLPKSRMKSTRAERGTSRRKSKRTFSMTHGLGLQWHSNGDWKQLLTGRRHFCN